MNKITTTVIISSIILIFSLIAYLLFSSEVSNKEAGLISLLLTILSVIVSYIVSHYFAESSYKKAIDEVKQQHQENLKVYALNAAEKVSNLSNELTKLSLYIQNEIDYEEDDESPELINLSLEERLRSTIHIVNTLKSINDTSLSDWRGVIGEELDEQKEEQLEREQLLLDLINRIEDLQQKNNNSQSSKEIKELNGKINFILNSISGSNIPRLKVSKKPVKEDISNECPSCKASIIYKQRANEKSHKPIKCENCGQKATARYDKIKGFYLIPESITTSSEQCLWCNDIINIEYSNIPFSSKICNCPNCNGKMKVSTNINGVQLRKYGNKPVQKFELTDDLIGRVEKLLPKQPWPTGVHKEIAHQLEVPEHIISLAIKNLISQGKFLIQVDGILYDKVGQK